MESDLDTTADIIKRQDAEIARLSALDAEACRDRDTWHRLADEARARAEQAERENERLRAALLRCRDMVGHPDNIAFINAALGLDEQQAPTDATPDGWLPDGSWAPGG